MRKAKKASAQHKPQLASAFVAAARRSFRPLWAQESRRSFADRPSSDSSGIGANRVGVLEPHICCSVFLSSFFFVIANENRTLKLLKMRSMGTLLGAVCGLFA